jgi:hypothetical protein
MPNARLRTRASDDRGAASVGEGRASRPGVAILPRAAMLLAAIGVGLACTPREAGQPARAAVGPASAGGALARHAFAATEATFPNPERGLFEVHDLLGEKDFSELFARGQRVVHGRVSLGEFRDAPLSADLLARVSERLEAVRHAGLKVLLRFAYGFRRGAEDASRERVLAHIAQLEPLLRANEDVVVAMELGFIGPWGEGHSSAGGLDTPQVRGDVLHALLEALPRSRMVMVRSPGVAQSVFGPEPRSEAQAYGGSDADRVGFHDDCLLADASDGGTYAPGPVGAWKEYAERWTRFVATGGETCRLTASSYVGKTAIRELARFHWSMLNATFNRKVIEAWKAQGAFDEIQRRLGYRFSLVEGEWPSEVRAGDAMTLSLRLNNGGFASPFNARPIFVVLRNGASRHVLPVEGTGTDPRRWWAGVESQLVAEVVVPAAAEPGRWRLALWLPDAAPSLRDRPEYAIRLANEAVWDERTGENVLARDFEIRP